MTTSAPKMHRPRWLALRRTPRGIPWPQAFTPAGINTTKARDGSRYYRETIPARAAVTANTRLWPHRKARKARPATLGPAVNVNPRPHYSKADAKRMKRLRRQAKAAA